MKNLRIGLLLTAAIFILSACSAGNEASSAVSATDDLFVDGTYTAEGDKWDFGHEEATVVIKDNKIDAISLQRIDLDGNEIDYKAYQEMGGPDLSDARNQLSASIIKTQSIDVEAVSGATISSSNWKIAVERAIAQAQNK